MPHELPEAPGDEARLRHMIDAARSARRFAEGRSRADLDNDEQFRRSLTHCFIEIGEAAARISESARARIPDLPWGQIVHVRHIVIHVYWGVDLDRLWAAIDEDLPPLILAIDRALSDWSD
jgi:uncharacterized protein with HEPN domain